ncbi:hypothetical protein C8R45DRAFT_1093196 [Mycena sanguinolenta]|nr:hypothetical protein C8R45DRAFT_1093196 [Mycena sanguinolenta]
MSTNVGAIPTPRLYGQPSHYFNMDFWTSDEIAPYVRSCKLAPWEGSLWRKIGRAWTSFQSSSTDSPHILSCVSLELVVCTCTIYLPQLRRIQQVKAFWSADILTLYSGTSSLSIEIHAANFPH